MIGVMAQDGLGAIKLFGQQDSDKGMRQGQRREAPSLMRPGLTGIRKTFWATHQENNTLAHGEPPCHLGGQGLGPPGFTLHLQRNHVVIALNHRQHSLAFILFDAFKIGVFPPFSGRDLAEDELTLPRKSLGVILVALCDPLWHPMTDGKEMNLHKEAAPPSDQRQHAFQGLPSRDLVRLRDLNLVDHMTHGEIFKNKGQMLGVGAEHGRTHGDRG